jgi:1-deoxy-D-xylulose-5-phosphate synthase
MASVFDCPARLEILEVGRGVVLQEGRDVALVGVGSGVGIALEAAAQLSAQGFTPTVVDARFVKPLDTGLLDRLASSHRRIVTIEENALAGGFGSAVLETLAGHGVEVVRFGLPDAFVPHGDRERLLADVGLTADAVVAAVALRPVGLAQAR